MSSTEALDWSLASRGAEAALLIRQAPNRNHSIVLKEQKKKIPWGKRYLLQPLCRFLVFPGLKRWGNIWKDLTGTSLQENHQICKNASRGIWQTSRRAVPDMAARPCRPGNMAAVTNKESHMPLSSFMFKYKHRLWCISGRYFQLSNVNLYLLTFTARLMPHCFSYLKRRFTGRGGGGRITTVFIQLSCRCLRFRCSPGEHRHRTFFFF